ncbi:hypothetical protein CK203_023414 [Vitis vinifera]|uniref:Endonuclease/exonuclease/phosphatase domain-containing protein n=1 Tax=Vitis vinifera TaxID=29760 RepID=A0A438J6L5_VITVI|nr:hypothetical protein CK203_023414 [Vitis vinifera]
MGWQESNLGWFSKGDQTQETRLGTIVKDSGGPNAERGPVLSERRPIPIGSDLNQPKRWAQVGSGPEAVLEEVSLNQPIARNKGNESLENRRLLDCKIASYGRSLEGEHLVIWESEEARSSWEKAIPSATDKALAEEAMRYDSGLRLEREGGCGSFHLISYSFDRTPVGESFDHSGVLEESNDVGPGMDDKGCWDMVEFNKDLNLVRGWSGTQRGQNFKKPEERKRIDGKKAAWPKENEGRLWEGSSVCKESSGKVLRLVHSEPNVGKGWEEENWEESELAKFREEAEGWNDSRRGSVYGGQMKLRILSWNVRGVNDSAKRKVIKAMIRSQRVDMFCLQETKIQSMTEGLVRSLGTGRFLNWGTMDAQGTAGGILICWDKRTLELMELEVGCFSISCRMRNVEDGRVWMFTGVYGPFSKEEREWMWEELGAIRGIWEDPWCIGGDFNVTLSLRERSNQGRLTSAMRRFAQVVDELELIDLPLQGGMLTWSGGRNNQAWARLDRFLVTQGWLDHFNEVVQCRLPRPTSDHFPIVLMGEG